MNNGMLETITDKELIGELASRHNELIVIRPKATNKKTDVELVVFCKTKEDGYDIFDAMGLMHDAEIGLMGDSIEVDNE